jgi:ATP-dependent Clp endopeptidase proteolytic subunit ClpP
LCATFKYAKKALFTFISMNTGWIYTVDPLAEEPIMLINNHIGFDSEDGMGIDGGQFQSELLALDGMAKKRIQVWINSPGGSVMDGYNIYSAILKSVTKVDTYCTGMAASIAGVIFQAGRKRYMCDYSFLMYHNPSGTDDGKLISMMKGSIATMTARSGKSEDDILKIMNKETFINPTEALEYGLCDEIEVSSEQNKKRMSVVPAFALYKTAKTVLNQLFEHKNDKIMTMIKVTNKLNLNPDANEDSIVAQITAIENKAKEDKDSYEAKAKGIQQKMKDLEEQMDKLKKEKEASDEAKNKAETDVANMKKEKDDAEDKMKDEEAKNVVNTYVKAGRIKNEVETISFWTAILKADKELGKKQLDALPLNKLGVNIEVAATAENADLLTSGAARTMADVRNKLKIN